MLRCAAAVAMAALVAGCGFHLRGAGGPGVEVPVHLTAERDTALVRSLGRGLEAAGVTLLDERSADSLHLHVLDEREEERTVSVTDRARVSEYELVLEVRFEIAGADDRTLVEPRWVGVQRIYRVDRDNLAGSGRERELLRREMEIDLSQQVARSLSAVGRTAPANTPPSADTKDEAHADSTD